MRTSEELVQEFDKVSSDVGRLQAWESTLLPEEMQLLADRLIPRVGGSRFTELHGPPNRQQQIGRARAMAPSGNCSDRTGSAGSSILMMTRRMLQ